jgi:ubiquinone biosynthesis protein UbiJ
MATQSPFSFVEDFFKSLPVPTPPAWAIEETHRKCVLVLNHVLMQEPQAMQRLVRQSGRVILTQWRSFTFKVQVTPAGLLDLSDADTVPDLTLVLSEDSVVALAQGLLQGNKPAVRIEGDVQLAAEVNWLADNVRWDVEEDLSRVLGDSPAHLVVGAGRKMSAALHDFLGQKAQAATDADAGKSA